MKENTKQTTNLSREEKRARREQQVKRQKALLASVPVFLLLIAAAVFFFASTRKEVIYKINAACQSYRPQVEREAAEYGMSDYVDLILALMMQESSGNGPDLLQSSEGAYNTKYPQEPNGIKDTTYSIQCGIQELKYSMEKANVQSPSDIEHIKLALQGYNFGADVYFAFLEENNTSVWSEESAEAFAEMASGGRLREEDDPFRATAGPWDYGDQRYPEHVLRYYHLADA
jgi:hypothetical protein